jgi:hypothetical protein
VPALRLTPGDHVAEWVNTHELSRFRGNTFARMPAGCWPAFRAAAVARAVKVSRLTPEADPSDLFAEHGPERAIVLAWERYEASVEAWSAKHHSREVAW